MSKSTGNFLTLAHAVEKYSADGVRLALADAGDSMDDANIKEEMAEAGLLRIYALFEWFNLTLDILQDPELQVKNQYRTGPFTMHADFIFENEINLVIELADQAFQDQEYREVSKIAFYEFQSIRDRYKEICQGSVHVDLIKRYMNVQIILLSPICSHICEYIWLKLANNKTTIFGNNWPKLTKPVDELLTLQGHYINTVSHEFRLQLKQYMSSKSFKASKAGVPKVDTTILPPSKATIWVAIAYPPWQEKIIEVMASNISSDGKTLPDNALIAQLLRPHLKMAGKMAGKMAKRAMPFAQLIRERFQTRGRSVLQLQLEIDEADVIESNMNYLLMTLGLEVPNGLKICYASDSNDQRIIESVCPLEPLILFQDPPVSIPITFVNPDIGTGLFTLNSIPVCDGDSTVDVVTRLLKHCRLSMPASKNIRNLDLYRFVHPNEEYKIPPISADSIEQINKSAQFVVNQQSSSLCLVSDKGCIPLGSKLIYRISASL